MITVRVWNDVSNEGREPEKTGIRDHAAQRLRVVRGELAGIDPGGNRLASSAAVALELHGQAPGAI